jgi:cell cycle sensor histidine kinase DivJ
LPEVLIDASKYRQVLLNLLSNAHKYSERGTPIEISTRQESWDGRVWIVLQVKDFGIGMTELELSRIGQPFFRANQNDSIGGTGLGISVVKEIVEFHQGRLTFASKPNVGTIATVWFPVESLALKK